MNEFQPGIYRAKLDFEKGFVRAPNEWMRDSTISLKAKGLLIYLLSHESGYMISIDQIVRETADGTTAVRSAMKELIEAKYLDTKRTHDERGYNRGLAYILQDPRTLSPEERLEPVELDSPAEPELQNPNQGNPNQGNQSAYRKQLPLEEKALENKQYGDSANAPIEQEFQDFYRLYPRKVKPLAAKRAFIKARKSVSYQTILEGVTRFANDPNLPKDKVYIPHPSTWLNDGSWSDELLPERPVTYQDTLAIKAEKEDRQTEASRESARLALAEAEAAEANARANPAPRCEHNRVAVICDTCNKKTATIKSQQSGGTN
jgi:hypothetical protein